MGVPKCGGSQIWGFPPTHPTVPGLEHCRAVNSQQPAVCYPYQSGPAPAPRYQQWRALPEAGFNTACFRPRQHPVQPPPLSCTQLGCGAIPASSRRQPIGVTLSHLGRSPHRFQMFPRRTAASPAVASSLRTCALDRTFLLTSVPKFISLAAAPRITLLEKKLFPHSPRVCASCAGNDS